MKSARAAIRRHLPTSPFNAPAAPERVTSYAVQDRVTHDRYGMGVVVGVEDGVAVLVDFGAETRRLLLTDAKLSAL